MKRINIVVLTIALFSIPTVTAAQSPGYTGLPNYRRYVPYTPPSRPVPTYRAPSYSAPARQPDPLEQYFQRRDREDRRWRDIQRDLRRQDEADGLNILRNCAKYNRGCWGRLKGSGK